MPVYSVEPPFGVPVVAGFQISLPGSSRTLLVRGGNRGLLVNSENLCERKRFGYLNLRAQNSRKLKDRASA